MADGVGMLGVFGFGLTVIVEVLASLMQPVVLFLQVAE